VSEPSKPIPDRLTVVEQIVHFNHRSQRLYPISSAYSHSLATSEQPYERPLVATEEWQPLDCGWIKGCSALYLHNEEGTNLQAFPSDEEARDIAARVIEVAFDHAGVPPFNSWIIRPGMTMRATPSDPRSLMVRCRKGEARFMLCLFPE
jgi:hypothetical protein